MHMPRRLAAGVSATALAMCGLLAVAAPAGAATTIPAGFAALVASDSFNHPSNGLGTADLGGTWSTNTPASTGVGHADLLNIAPGRSGEAFLDRVNAANVTVTDRFSVASLNTAGKLYHAVEARRQSDASAYLGKVTAGGDGTLRVSFSRRSGWTETLLGGAYLIPATFTAGQQIQVDFQVTGTTTPLLKIRAYPAGTAAPDWQTTYTDTSASAITSGGEIGYWDYLNSAAVTTTVSENRIDAWTADTAAAAAQPAGALPVGQTRYQIPDGAVFVSTSGSDSNAGTADAPMATINAAIAAAGQDGTVIVRGGAYHQGITDSSTTGVTVQNYPGEAVWLDGSQQVSGFNQSGSTWTAPWTTTFDHSSSFTRGDTAGPATDAWSFINPNYTMAAWPDQVFVDGQQQTQVASNPGAGQFAVNYSSHQLILGSNPSGHLVEATTLIHSAVVTAANVQIQGIGMRRFADALPDMGAVVLAGQGDGLENVQVVDAATQAISLQAAGITADHDTIVNPGMTGIHANKADNLVVDNDVVTGANAQHFNTAPAAAGMKITSSHNIAVTNSTVTGSNNAHGIWLDENVIGFNISGNTLSNNGGAGINQIRVELSSGGGVIGQGGVIGDNTVGAADIGIDLTDASNVQVVNNSLTSAIHGEVWALGDARSASPDPQSSARPTPDNTWQLSNLTIEDNAFAWNGSNPGAQLYIVDQKLGQNELNQGHIINGNTFHTPVSGAEYMTIIGLGNGQTPGYWSPAALNQAFGQNWSNNQVGGHPSASDLATFDQTAANGVHLPAAIANAEGATAGSSVIGSF